MTIYYMPAVVPIAYPSLSRLCGDRLPATFEAWRVSEDLARRDLVAQGHHVVGVCVEPVDLDRYRRSSNRPADAAALAALAARRGAEIHGGEANYQAYRAEIVVVDDVRAARPEIVETVGGPRPWWAFWRPRTRTVAADGAVRPGVLRDVPRIRRPWWAFWRRDDRAIAPG